MNKQIKFRAWDKENKSWYFIGYTLEDITCIGKNKNKYMWEYEIMQYTGLKDKNGKEIYEGDIIRVAYISNNINFGDDIFYKVLEVKKTDRGYSPFCISGCIDAEYSYSIEDVEIIGNIYQNKELLNE